MNFASTTLYTVIQTVVKMLAGFVVIKIVAALAGPEGVASLGIIQNINLIFVMLCGGVMSTGITQHIASNGINKQLFRVFNAIKKLETQLVPIATALIFVIISVLIFFSHKEYEVILPTLLVTLLLTYFHAKVLLYIAELNGLFKIKELANINICASLFSMVMSVTVYFLYPIWELAVVSLPLGYAVVCFFIKNKRHRFHQNHKLGFNRGTKKSLIQFALFGLVSSICLPVSQLIIRNYIANTVSIHDSGIWQGLVRFSEVYLVLISSALSVFLIPKLSNMKNGTLITSTVLKVLFIVSIASILGMFFIYYLRGHLIVFLFDKSFLNMGPLFVYQLPGDFFKIISWVFAFSMLGLGCIKKMLFLEVIFSFTYILLSIFGTGFFGIKGAVAAYSINYIIYFFAIAILFGVEIGKRKNKLS